MTGQDASVVQASINAAICRHVTMGNAKVSFRLIVIVYSRKILFDKTN